MDHCTELNKIDSIYRNIPLDEIPWNVEVPPDAIVELVEGGLVKPAGPSILGAAPAIAPSIFQAGDLALQG